MLGSVRARRRGRRSSPVKWNRRSSVAGAVVEVPVPVVGGPDHAVAEPVGGDRELDRHRRHVGRRRPDLEHLAAVAKTSSTIAGATDPGQEVGADHPLVVLRDVPRAARGEALRRRRRARQRVDDAVVEADEGEVRLGDGQVLVVARIGDDRRPLSATVSALGARAGQVEAVAWPRIARRGASVPIFRWTPSLVELGRRRVVRAGTVERVEVEARRAALQQLRRRHVLAEHDRWSCRTSGRGR